ncbi:MAG: hypothetical protein GC165_05065 [Armatimonadetes bacterium]|nr:hypothetical protein [Armatimonadota bacterium]
MKSSPYRVLILGLCFGAACLLSLELLLRIRLVRKVLPLPSPYYNSSTMLREDLLEKYQKSDGSPEVVFMGSSISRANAEIGLFQQLTGKRSFGLGMSGLSPGRTEVYWRHFWSSRVGKPEVILHFVRTADLAEDYDARSDKELALGRIERGWLADPSSKKSLDERLLKSRVMQYYGSISKAIAGERHPFFGDPFVTDKYGSLAYHDSLVTTDPDYVRRSHHEGKYGSFAKMMKGSNAIAILRKLQNEVGTTYVLVYCPEYIDAWESPDDLADWRRSLRSMCDRSGFLFVDPTGLDPAFVKDPSNYHDYIHFDEKGARKFTHLLVQALTDQQLLR